MGLGWQVLAAARVREAGGDLNAMIAAASEVRARQRTIFTVDTLEYLHRGGRINSAKRLLGSALNLKPIMEIRDGKIELVESVISRKKALNRMVDLIVRDVAGRTPVRLAPFHALAFDDMVTLENLGKEQLNPIEIIRSEDSPMIGSHVGPGTVSMAYMAG